MNKAAITLALRGANRPKLAKMIANQNTTIIKNGHGSRVPICSKVVQRDRAKMYSRHRVGHYCAA